MTAANYIKEITPQELADELLEYPRLQSDCFVALSGNEGDGKSVIARYLTYLQYKRLGKPLDLWKVMYYGKAQLQEAMEQSNKEIFIHDEAIDNFNRTFFEQAQIFFVKSSRIIRDHNHIVYMCLPVLWELDRSIRSRVRFYLYVVKRVNLETKAPGIVYVFKRSAGAFVPDSWYLKANQKLEQLGSIHKSPNFRGYMKIPYIEDEWFIKMEAEAQLIKDKKRSEVFESNGKKNHTVDNTSFAFAIHQLKKQGILEYGQIQPFCENSGINPRTIFNLLSDLRQGHLTIQTHQGRILLSGRQEEVDIDE